MGSMADQLSLLDALDGYLRAERLATLLEIMEAQKNADARHHVLTHYALRCGYRAREHGTVIEFAAKRVETIRRTFPNHIKEAGR